MSYPYKIVTDREIALERENERLTDQAKRQSATIHVQAVAIQSMTEEIEASERNLEQLTDELAQSRAALKAQADDPEFDGIENANPAWWRGHWHSAEVFCQKVNEILDGKDDGSGFGNPPWEPTRRRLLALKAQPVQEPVAYMVQFSPGDRWVEITKDEFDSDLDGAVVYKKQAFYAAPVQPVQPALSDEQIMAIAKPFIRSVGRYSQHEDAIPDNGVVEDFARAIEAAVRTGGAG